MLSLRSILVAVLLQSTATATEEIDFDRPVIGAKATSLEEASPVFRELKMRMPSRTGIVLFEISPYGPAAKAGLKPLDIVTSVNGTQVTDRESFSSALADADPTKPILLRGYRQTGSTGKTLGQGWRRGNSSISLMSYRELILASLNRTDDAFKGAIIYRHKDAPYLVSSRTALHCYIIQVGEGEPRLRMTLQYVANDWLFVQKYSVKADGDVIPLHSAEFFDVERDNSGGRIWEWVDEPVDETRLKHLANIASAKKSIIRFEGKQYYRDFEIPDYDRESLTLMLNAFQMMKDEMSH